MDKISISQEDNTLHNAETFVLDKLFNKDGSEDYLVNIGELMTSIDNTTMSPLLDQALEELIAESLIRSEDGENYQITPDGISELKIRKSEPIPL
ncbi:MAG TPA: hypothetical protein VD815_05730 [Candidatus Saccharimonadales bacterium]|nr:hypothetical protein [Candidatus Saccharimonadales bacterium]